MWATTSSRPACGLTKSVMPKRRPHSSRVGLMSTPTIRSAPAIFAPWMTLSPMPPRPKTTTLSPGLDLGGVDHRADARGHAAADVAAGLERRVLADLRHRDLGQHGEVREGRAAHVVEDRLALVAEAAGAVGHQPLALRRADRGAQVGLAAEARLTLAAFGGVERDDVVAGRDVVTPGADLAHDARALMAEDEGKMPFAVEPVERVGVGVADAGRHDLDQHLARLRPFEVELDDLERLLGLEGDGGAGFHRSAFLAGLGWSRPSCHGRARRPIRVAATGRRTCGNSLAAT